MKILYRNPIHLLEKSHDCLIAEFGNIKNGGKKAKITYESYNAIERCNVDFFDGNKWNHIFSMLDMGIEPNTSAYNIWDAAERKKRADTLFDKAKEICLTII